MDKTYFRQFSGLEPNMQVLSVIAHCVCLIPHHPFQKFLPPRVIAAPQNLCQSRQYWCRKRGVPAGIVRPAQRIIPPDGVIMKSVDGTRRLHPAIKPISQRRQIECFHNILLLPRCSFAAQPGKQFHHKIAPITCIGIRSVGSCQQTGAFCLEIQISP